MPIAGAVQQAVDLAERPGLAAIMRRRPLPLDTLVLIQIAAGSKEAVAAAADAHRRRPEFIGEAAVLYLQQILFHAGADPYRTLGVAPDAPQEEISRNMRLLMKWLHPDRQRDEWESAYAERILGAWEILKSAERRAVYDAARRSDPKPYAHRPKARRNHVASRPRNPWIGRGMHSSPPRVWAKRSATIVALILAAGVALWAASALDLWRVADGARTANQDQPADFLAVKAGTADSSD